MLLRRGLISESFLGEKGTHRGSLIQKVSFLRVAVECQIFWGTARTAAVAWESHFRDVFWWPLRRWTLCSPARWQKIHTGMVASDRMERKVETTVLWVFFCLVCFPNLLLHLPWPTDCVGRADRLTSWKRGRQFCFEASSKRWHSSSHSSAQTGKQNEDPACVTSRISLSMDI